MSVSFNDFKKKFVIQSSSNISTSVVDLPSGRGKATLRPMKVKEQRDFLKALEKRDEVLLNAAFDNILSTCVETVNGEPFDNDEVYIQDRTFLLIKIRQITTGNEAKISHICPVSQKLVNDIPINLDNLVIDVNTDTLFKDIDLSSSVRISLGPVTRKNEKSIEKWIKSKNKDNSMIDRKYCAYATVIKNLYYKNEETQQFEIVDGLTFDNLVEFITEHCSQKELDMLDEYVKSLDFGIRLRFHFKSDEYENENEEANLISFFIM